MRNSTLLLFLLLLTIGCKDEKKLSEETKETTGVEKLNVSNYVITAQLMNEFVAKACTDPTKYSDVYKSHSIDVKEFNYYTKAFWPTKAIDKISKTVLEMENIINSNDCEEYIRFRPTSEFKATDIIFTDIIPNGNYLPEDSCYSISLFKSIIDQNSGKINPNSKFYFTKGSKIITKIDGTREIKTTVPFYIEFNDSSKSILYFDIADDPTHRVQ